MRPFKIKTEDDQIISFEPVALLECFHDFVLCEPDMEKNEKFLHEAAALMSALSPELLFCWAAHEQHMHPFVDGRSEEVTALLVSAITDFGKRMQKIQEQESEELSRFYEQEAKQNPRKPALIAKSRIS